MDDSKLVVEVGYDDHTSYFTISRLQALEILRLPKEKRWNEFEDVREDAELHSDGVVNLFWDASGYTDEEINEQEWHTMIGD